MRTANCNLVYEQHGDYYLPLMELTEEEQRPLGRYGRERFHYMREHRPGLYTRMLLAGTLFDQLHEIDEAAQRGWIP